MNLHAYQQFQAQRDQLAGILAQTPSEQIIDRCSLEARIKRLDESLGTVQQPARLPARAVLTFRGRPVVGSHGVFAEFGAAAIDKFSDAIATLAASLEGPLGTRGTLPNRENYRMLITGTAIGSFGFELEENIQNDTSPCGNPSPVEEALEQAKTILKATQGTDEDLAEAISGTDLRALGALREFVKTLANGEAVCSLEFGKEPFRFLDVGAVQRSERRLSLDTIHESEETLAGAFDGVLPKHRTFEFRLKDTGDIISGKVGGAIANAAEINGFLNRSARITVLSTRVGSGRPRYRLLDYQIVDAGSQDASS